MMVRLTDKGDVSSLRPIMLRADAIGAVETLDRTTTQVTMVWGREYMVKETAEKVLERMAIALEAPAAPPQGVHPW